MGWTWYFDRPVSVKADMDEIYTSTGTEPGPNGYDIQVRPTLTVLRSAIVNLREYYCAVEVVQLNGDRRVMAGVAMLGYNGTNGCAFGYKDMSENMGPCIRSCPEAILDLLTPTDCENSLEWRADCRKKIADRKAKPRLTNGCVIAFDPPIKAGDGTIVEKLQVLDVSKSRFHDLTNNMTYRAPWMKKYNYTIVEGGKNAKA